MLLHKNIKTNTNFFEIELLENIDTFPIITYNNKALQIEKITNKKFKIYHNFNIGIYELHFLCYYNHNKIEENFYVEILNDLFIDSKEIQIDNHHLGLVKKVLGYPLIDQFFLNDDQIKLYAIYPALLDYFRKFPIREEIQYNIGQGRLEIDFPDKFTYGILDARFVSKGEEHTNAAFWDIVRYNMYQPSYFLVARGSYNTRFNFNQINQLNVLNKLVFDTYKNFSTQKVYFDYEKRKLYAYTTIYSKLFIVWAKYSLNFNKVKFERINDVIALAQLYLLNHLIDMGSIYEDSQIDRRINVDALRTKAEYIYNEIIKEGWNTIQDVVLLRSALL